MQPLYIICTVFNPRRFKSRVKLYQDFARWVQSCGLELITVEVAYGDRPHEVTRADNPHHLQLRTVQDLWHKERALNLGVQLLTRLHPEWDYFAYLDADVKIVRNDWAEETVHLLQHYAILQPFGQIQTLDPQHHTLYGGRSIARGFHEDLAMQDCDGGKYPGGLGWPGLGWAYRRKEFEEIGGLLDVCVTGSGDTHMAACYMGRPEYGMPKESSPGFRKAVMRYAELCDKHVKRNLSYVPGLLVHFWHGKAKVRGYDKRRESIVKHAFDPHEDLKLDAQGLYAWRGNKKMLEYEIRRSMELRNEDGTDL